MSGAQILYLIVLPLMVVAVVLAAWAGNRRVARMRSWAADRGLTCTAEYPAYASLDWGPPFGVGVGRRARSVVSGRLGDDEVLAFTLTYRGSTTVADSEGHGQRSTVRYVAVYALRHPGRVDGWVRVRPVAVGGRIARAGGIHDIELESERFNRTYEVTASDPRLASDLLSPRVMEWLLANDVPRLRLTPTHLVVDLDGAMAVERIEPAVATLREVRALVAPHVWTPRG